jgi:hypothetical protein
MVLVWPELCSLCLPDLESLHGRRVLVHPEVEAVAAEDRQVIQDDHLLHGAHLAKTQTQASEGERSQPMSGQRPSSTQSVTPVGVMSSPRGAGDG